MKDTISVIGLGKLGLCLAACFAERGFDTIGIDINEQTVNSINDGISPLVETGLDKLISKTAGKSLKAASNHRLAIEETDVTFILVQTPSNPDGMISNKYVTSVLKALASALKDSDKEYHLFVISSTVMPGSIEKEFVPLIEKNSGRKLNVGFGMCYVPEFVALGSVIKDFLNPDLVVIGESGSHAGEIAEVIYQKFCLNNPPIIKMSPVNAEITKMSLNVYMTLKISYANLLSNICEKLPGADVDVVTKALGFDRRISPYYLKGGLSYGGTCFPRDVKGFIAFARQHKFSSELVEAVDRANQDRSRIVAETVLQQLSFVGGKTAAVLGVAFKPNTPVITESPAVKIIDELLKNNINVIVYDPLAMENTRALFGDKIQYASSAKDCFAQSSVCVITTQADEFKRIDESFIANDPTVIIDCWRILNPAGLGEKTVYVPVGRWKNVEKIKTCLPAGRGR